VRVAVSGATGFIGRHVVDELLRRNVEVLAIVRPGSAPDRLAKEANSVALDLSRPADSVYAACGHPDVLMHLAWGGLPHYKSLHHFEDELPLHYRFLKAMIDGGCKNVLATGTCFEYGMQSGALDESMATQPTNPYGFAKDALRCQLEYLKTSSPFHLAWARLFYLYGEGQAASSLYPLLKSAALRGDKRFDLSLGEQLRDYLPVQEVARILVDLALAKCDVGVVNVCSGQPISIRRLVEAWAVQQGWALEFNFGKHPYPDYEPLAFWGCDKKLKTVLKASP
jgi:dTDP-6-deoxy-L-talose 4-dehydrogenase (NAD+)